MILYSWVANLDLQYGTMSITEQERILYGTIIECSAAMF